MSTNLWDISRGYSGEAYGEIVKAFNAKGTIRQRRSPAFHYTAFDTCLNMLKYKKSDKKTPKYLELFASHISYMNDTKEFVVGLETILCTLKNILNTHPFDPIADSDIVDTAEGFINTYKNYLALPAYAVPPHYIVCFNKDFNNLAQWKYYGKNSGISIEYDLGKCEFSGYSTQDSFLSHKAYYVNYNSNNQNAEINNILVV